MPIEVREDADPAVRAQIGAILRAHNRAMLGEIAPGAELALILRGADAAVIGGAAGRVWAGWLDIDLLLVPPPLRGAGLGTAILTAMERAARARGATGAWLHSLDAQAPGFYLRHGYREIGVLRDRPPGGFDVFLAKPEGLGDGPPGLAGMPAVVQTAEADATAAEDRRVLRALLVAETDARAGAQPWGDLALLARDAAGEVRGGLWARMGRGWLYVDLLAVAAEARRGGLGRALMAQAEDWARAHGCAGVHVDSFTFQAPGFYERIGYRAFGRIDDYPAGHTRFLFEKRFTT